MLVTEQANPKTAELDRLPTLEAVRLMNAEDAGVAEAVRRALPAVARAIDGIVARLSSGGRLFYVGTGTSGRLGVLDASECPPTFGVPPELVQGVIAGGYEACYRAVEASEDDRAAGARDLDARGVGAADVVVGIAASGRTPYTIGAVEYARERGALTIGVTCNPETALAAASEIAIEAIVGPEAIAGSTRLKAGTAQKLVLNMLSTVSLAQLGYVTGNRMTSLKPRNLKLKARALGIVQDQCGLEAEAARSLLEQAGWDQRIAIIMHRAQVSRPEAEEALRRANHSIARALSELAPQG